MSKVRGKLAEGVGTGDAAIPGDSVRKRTFVCPPHARTTKPGGTHLQVAAYRQSL